MVTILFFGIQEIMIILHFLKNICLPFPDEMEQKMKLNEAFLNSSLIMKRLDFCPIPLFNPDI